MKTRIILATALGVTLFGGSAFAGQAMPGRHGPGMMAPGMMADANGDGVITRDEVAADVTKRFEAMDTNHDGKVTPDERMAYMQAQRAAMAGRMGQRMAARGGDQTLDQMKAKALARFDRIDTNHDGKIDQAERDAVRERMMQMRGRFGHQGQGPDDMAPPADAPAPDGN